MPGLVEKTPKNAKLYPMGTDAYETAKAGGKHWGTLKNSRLLPDNLIEKSIRSLDKRINEHQAKIADPAA